MRIALMAADSGADALTTAGWSGPANYINDTAKISAVIRSWQDRFGVRAVGLAGYASLYLTISRVQPVQECVGGVELVDRVDVRGGPQRSGGGVGAESWELVPAGEASQQPFLGIGGYRDRAPMQPRREAEQVPVGGEVGDRRRRDDVQVPCGNWTWPRVEGVVGQIELAPLSELSVDRVDDRELEVRAYGPERQTVRIRGRRS